MGQTLPFPGDASALDPDTLAVAARAYDKAVAHLGIASAAVRETIATRIIQLVAEGERDPDTLCERALAAGGIPAEIDRSAAPPRIL